MYPEPFTVYGGDSFDLICSYNASYVTPDHFLSFERGYKLNSVAIDNHTIVYRILKTPDEGALLSFYCNADDQQIWIELIVIPKLNVRDFECISEGEELAVKCSFGRLGNKAVWDYMEYYLRIDNGESDKCKAMGNRVECNTKYSNATTENLKHTFTLEMTCNRNVQKKFFHLSRTQMKVPPWGKDIMTTTRGIFTCMGFEVSTILSRNAYHYKVRLLLKNPRIMEIMVEPIKQHRDICFRTPRFNNVNFEVRVWRRYIGIDTPWTRDYYAFSILTEAFPPDRPPQLQPGVFFYEPKKNYLYIFWKELEELDLNRLDFTYSAETTTGKKAIAKTNSSAVFHHWDHTKSATVLVWNQNSVGRSENTSKLEVPALTDSLLHQPQDLWYHFENQSMTWKPPRDVNKLISYIVIWCSVSSNSTFLCEDQKPLHLESVPASIQNYQFNTQAADLNKAVVALYEDGTSGGMSLSELYL
ncbi:uncharacterized protein [Drosophila takahashii]|uniref:uncharacterized protein n=1 Tax=Drosophila takahashii TaxID=29030 RepID=UPI001CF86264|nr:cytokine receptor-like [Drosophila takahashii]